MATGAARAQVSRGSALARLRLTGRQFRRRLRARGPPGRRGRLHDRRRRGNITVNVGSNGLFVVDAGTEGASANVVAAIRTISDRPIRYLANTSADADHVGGNIAVRKIGQGIRSRENREEGAVIVAHEDVLTRMSAPTGKESPTPVAAWPTWAFPSAQQDLTFNGQAIQMFRLPAAHTDGDVVVLFRRSDVVATGDIFDPRGIR